ncbi:MAG: DUF1905 domain-containing protein [Chitinophagaceae bacterium]|nr:MAG: DUF1905 domain-containing protein [Chitinophagaceae bacterium]
MPSFSAEIFIIGINPYVLLPDEVLQSIFKAAGKNKGPIPVKGKIDGHPFKQTLVKYSGKWRLYLNNNMRSACGKQVKDTAHFVIQVDNTERLTRLHPLLKAALKADENAANVFRQLPPYLQKEIMRYINNLKTKAAIERNVQKAICFLLGKERFIGRDRP